MFIRVYLNVCVCADSSTFGSEYIVQYITKCVLVLRQLHSHKIKEQIIKINLGCTNGSSHERLGFPTNLY